ncbi:hypothetical protein AEAC466_02210 [Asticcacaulis sp. AC466]|uniref:DUF4282 domain-containing protein n=1 Tax=Asticcacaulis sp. AC466 TaxID=1282362 RepID=UPI0003C40D88|nr:DUF4282 domain-containing protein [Asticcacaulis sp. AC466]ESQ86021.1 hypothetical protein AEAC466_02210 [Asticcacaulis sp. AC466]
MQRTIRQVFGTTRPRDIWNDLLTFDRLVSKPIVHIVYWCGLGLLFICALGWLGIMIGTGIKDASVMGWLLSFGLTVVGFLGFLIGVLAWRSVCEFYLAVMNISEDLRYLRQFQEKLTQPGANPAPTPAGDTTTAMDVATAAPPPPAAPTDPEKNLLEDPFFRPRFEKREF